MEPSTKLRLLKQAGFTLLVVLIYRLGANIPLPGVDVKTLQNTAESLDRSGALGVLDLFSGGALANASILAIGIIPFITSSLAFQLLKGVVPSIKELEKQGPAGQRKVASLTRSVAIVLAVAQAVVIIKTLQNSTVVGFFPVDLFPQRDAVSTILAVSSLVVGFLVLLWLADLIGKRGIGSGMSIVVLASVLSSVVSQAEAVTAEAGLRGALVLAGVVVAALAVVVTLSQVERRVEIASAKQAGSRRGSASSYVPLRLLQAGVAPAIFAGAMTGALGAVASLFPEDSAFSIWATSAVQGTGVVPLLVLGALVLFFTYFYTAIQFNTAEIADDLAKRGMFIVGVRPGEDTVHRLAWTLSRLAIAAGLVLAVVAVLPLVVQEYTGVSNVPLLGMTLLIATSVATDTARQLKAKASLHDYDSVIEGNSRKVLGAVN